MMDTALNARDVTLADLLDRVFDRGVVLTGDITISVAGVDLVSLRLSVLLASVERAAELGMTTVASTGRLLPETGYGDSFSEGRIRTLECHVS